MTIFGYPSIWISGYLNILFIHVFLGRRGIGDCTITAKYPESDMLLHDVGVDYCSIAGSAGSCRYGAGEHLHVLFVLHLHPSPHLFFIMPPEEGMCDRYWIMILFIIIVIIVQARVV